MLSDVHGNAVALQAVLREVADAAPLAVFGGDLTWGSLPEETRKLVDSLRQPAIFVRGNAERALAEAAARIDEGSGGELTARERWMVERHSRSTRPSSQRSSSSQSSRSPAWVWSVFVTARRAATRS